jgi:nicotinamide/nicotinate riboside kinase
MSIKPLCIGIGGVSRSGKTFLANLLQKAIPDSVVIHQDTYIPPESDIPRIKNHIDWERPEAIDWFRFREAIGSGILSRRTVIVEGLFAFYEHDINSLYNKTIFISLSQKVFLERKRIDLRWGKEPDWYIRHIWHSYLNYGQIPGTMKDILLIDGAKDIDLPVIMNYLQQNWR